MPNELMKRLLKTSFLKVNFFDCSFLSKFFEKSLTSDFSAKNLRKSRFNKLVWYLKRNKIK